jgi:polysaccharide deacetylase 2 family uncharacterized protein YibQ
MAALLPKLLMIAWLVFGLMVFGIIIWMLVSSDSITAEMERQQPRAKMALEAGGDAPSKEAPSETNKLPTLEKTAGVKNKTPGRKIAKPKVPESENAKPSLDTKPLLSKELKKATLQLHPHPDPQLIERAPLDPLLIVGKDGRQPWRVYSRPFSKLEKKARIAIVFTGLGVSAMATESVIQNTPGAVTLAFAPFSRRLKDWIDISRAAGHEVLVSLPMEPIDYPINDPGPYTLLTSLPHEQNKLRIHWVLSRLTGYVGVSTFMASKCTTKPEALKPVIAELQSRGLLLLDIPENPLSAAMAMAKKMKMPVAGRDVFIDSIATRTSINARLAQAEKIAKTRGWAVAIAQPYPVTITQIARWAKDIRSRGLVLAPISAIAQASLKQ